MEKKNTKKVSKKETVDSPFKLNVKLEKDADGVKGRVRCTVELLQDGKIVARDSDFIKL